MALEKYDTPYDKFREFGPAALSDIELLTIIIRNGTRQENAYEIAAKILHNFGNEGRILGLTRVSMEELMEISGIGEIKAMCILCIVEISKRLSRQQKKEVLKVNNPQSIADYFMEEVRHLDNENVLLLLVDTKCSLIKTEHLSKGSVNRALISTRDIFMTAIRNKASGIILIHNHPSGDPTPSSSDIDITLRIKQAGELMEIPLFDHIIIGDKRYISLKQNGLI